MDSASQQRLEPRRNRLAVVWRVYAPLVLVLTVAVLMALNTRFPNLVREAMAVPASASLLGIALQLIREEWAHQRALEREREQRDQELGVFSHMARVAFDKRVEFCDEYRDVLVRGIREDVLTGGGRRPLVVAQQLADVRTKHSNWVSAEIEEGLLPLEKALTEVGAGNWALETLPQGDDRRSLVHSVMRYHGLILGHRAPESEDERRMCHTEVLRALRVALGTDELSQVWRWLIRSARTRASG